MLIFMHWEFYCDKFEKDKLFYKRPYMGKNKNYIREKIK